MNEVYNLSETELIAEQIRLNEQRLRLIAVEELKKDVDPTATLINIAESFQTFLVQNGYEELRHTYLFLFVRSIIDSYWENDFESLQEILQRVAEVQQISEEDIQLEF